MCLNVFKIEKVTLSSSNCIDWKLRWSRDHHGTIWHQNHNKYNYAWLINVHVSNGAFVVLHGIFSTRPKRSTRTQIMYRIHRWILCLANSFVCDYNVYHISAVKSSDQEAFAHPMIMLNTHTHTQTIFSKIPCASQKTNTIEFELVHALFEIIATKNQKRPCHPLPARPSLLPIEHHYPIDISFDRYGSLRIDK